MTKRELAFQAWFDGQGFRNFSASEILALFRRSRDGVKNSLPPKSLWRNILPALRVLDDLRDHYGKPCTLFSTYRSEAYNKACGGAPRSQHKEFLAIDFKISRVSARHVYWRLLKWRQEGRFKGGLGLYVRSGFVHIDTRGRNATWKGN